MKKSARNFFKGFTLIELLVVIVILAILAMIGLVSYNKVGQMARETKIKQDIEAFQKAYENKFNNTTRTYSPVDETMFSAGVVPKTPYNTNYAIIFNVKNDGYRICGPLKDASKICTANNTDCYCLDSILGKYDATNTEGQVASGGCIAESDHPYIPSPNGYMIEYWYTITNPDTAAQASKIHFNRIDMADDVLFILDNDTYPTYDHNWYEYPCFTNNPGYSRFCNPSTNVITDVKVDGTVAKIRLLVDAGTGPGEVDWGFCVDQVSSIPLWPAP